MSEDLCTLFTEKAKAVGTAVTKVTSLQQAAEYIKNEADEGAMLVPETALAIKHNLKAVLTEAGNTLYEGNFREAGHVPAAGVTFCNFAMADSGSVVLESTPEEVRLATTIPEKHFVIVDPAKILADGLAAVDIMTELHSSDEPRFVAYITGPSRTADIERQLTIGCHGPREVHVLLMENISNDFMEI